MASAGHRALLRGFSALALTAVLALGAASVATAQAGRTQSERAALATERYYSSYGSASAQPGERAALAAERYYSSYGTPTPLHRSVAVAQAEDGGRPSWAAAIVAGLLLAIAAGGAGVFAGRFSTRPPRPRVTPAARAALLPRRCAAAVGRPRQACAMRPATAGRARRTRQRSARSTSRA